MHATSSTRWKSLAFHLTTQYAGSRPLGCGAWDNKRWASIRLRRKLARLAGPSRVVRSQVELLPWQRLRYRGMMAASEAFSARSEIRETAIRMLETMGQTQTLVAQIDAESPGARRLEHNGYDNPDLPEVPI